MRLDAARAKLAAHHSAPFAGMQRGRSSRGGGGKGGGHLGVGAADGGADMQTAQQMLWSLVAGAVGGQQQRGRAGPRSPPAAALPRPGEWACPCGFSTNRPHRVACFSCGRDRGGAASPRRAGGGKGGARKGGTDAWGKGPLAVRTDGRGGGGGGGPVGADGRRPLLGAHGAARSYSQVVSGAPLGNSGGAASWGAKGKGGEQGPTHSRSAAAAGGKGPEGGGLAKGGDWLRGTPQAVMEEDGFQMVQPRRTRARGGGHTDTSPGHAAEEQQRPCTVRQRWSELASDGDEDENMDYADDDAEWDDEAEDAGHAEEVDPRQLRASYEELSRAVRNLEKRGGFGKGSTALRALEEARDKAERAWRSAKQPAPLATRMAWAEAKRQKAEAVVSRARLAIEELDAEYEKQRELLYQKVSEAESWYRWRQQQCDDLHNEFAEKAPARRGAQKGGGGTQVKERIRDHLLPEVQSIMEYADGNPELLERLSLLAAGLVDAETRLEGESDAPETETFNMAEGDSDSGNWGDTVRDSGNSGGERCAQVKGGADTGGCKGKPSEWRSDGPGRWSRAAAAGKAGSASAGAAAQAAQAAQAEAGATTSKLEGALGTGGATGAKHAETGEETQGQGRGKGENGTASDGEDGGPPRSRRRKSDESASHEAREAADRRRAEELHAQQSAAAAAQVESFNAGEGGFGSQAALSLAAQRFVGEVQSAQRRATKRGVEAKAEDGRSLLELTPMELQEWVGKNLDGDDDC